MPEFRVAVDLGHLMPPDTPLGVELFPNLALAVKNVAQTAQAIWQGYANGSEALPGGAVIRPRSRGYLGSIRRNEQGPFRVEVFSDYLIAHLIEEGFPARDLKRMLDTSLRVRVTKSGIRYLIIPFSWGTPGTVTFGKNVMPQEVHDLWSGGKLAASSVTGMTRRVSGTGAYDIRTKSPITVPQRQYKWGARLTMPQLQAAGVHGVAARHMAGMVNFRNPAGAGGGAHSQYLTFRVMSERSSGWLVPAQPGKFPARTTAERIGPVAEKTFGAAAAEDLGHLMLP